MQPAWRPLAAMSVHALLIHRDELVRSLAACEEAGDDRAAHAADARGLAVSAELRDRLQQWLGGVPAADFLRAL